MVSQSRLSFIRSRMGQGIGVILREVIEAPSLAIPSELR